MDSGIFRPNEETDIRYRTVFGRTVIKRLMKRYAISRSSFPDFYRETGHVAFSGEKTGKKGHPEKAGTRNVRRSGKYPRSDKAIAETVRFTG